MLAHKYSENSRSTRHEFTDYRSSHEEKLFDISKEHLLNLSDFEVRELVARLCEAELLSIGVAVSSVGWGGAQTAPDGGLDVDCHVQSEEFTGDFVPRARTGFQVKTQAMPASRISDEMSPKGKLRPIFSQLAKHNGCYVIVSLKDDTSAKMLADRKRAMRRQIDEIRNHGDLDLRFYGRADLANWLRQHPSVELWTRKTLNLPLRGWRPYGQWSRTPKNADDTLICEEGVVIGLPTVSAQKLDISQGIEQIRKLLLDTEKALRIIGLSGVGKTRIVQALFEESVGVDALPESLAIYADLGEASDPSPRDVIERLIAENQRAFLILDNCPGSLHDSLARLVAGDPNIKLISIEYDIREDRQESTDVVRIDAEGTDIAEKLVLRRFLKLGHLSARRIAVLSGGNCQLAILLADAVKDEESLSGFSNEQLFDRLFFQRRTTDANLLVEAEVLALVYSFSMSRNEDGVDELGELARISGIDRHALYRAAQELSRRQLIQKRGPWRAVLPHAVANRLGARAIENIDTDEILEALEHLPSPRLLKSFGRRLGFLHNHDVARRIVESWMAPGGRLHNIGALDSNGLELLANVAPVAPEKVLRAIETASFAGWHSPFSMNPNADVAARLLASIAYDADLFERCVGVLAKLALLGNRENTTISNRLFSLFALRFSGTEASAENRERLMRQFLTSANEDKQELGIEMLESALHGRPLHLLDSHDFGARVRSYGYFPSTAEERDEWFLRFIGLTKEIATSDNIDLSEKARDILARALSNLWEIPAIRPDLARAVRALHAHRPWAEGLRSALHVRISRRRGWGSSGRTPEALKELDELIDALRPATLIERVRAHILSAGASFFSIDPASYNENPKESELSWRRGSELALELGMEVARDPKVLGELSQEMFTSQISFGNEFGKGLAEGTHDLEALLDQLAASLEAASDEPWQCEILEGVLQVLHERDGQASAKFLADAAKSPTLRRCIVNMHLKTPVPDTFKNLQTALDFEDTPIEQFSRLGWLESTALSEEEAGQLMRKLLDRPNGARVVLEAICTRPGSPEQVEIENGTQFKGIALSAIAQLFRSAKLLSGEPMTAHYLSESIRTCMNDAVLSDQIEEVLDALIAGLKSTNGHIGNFDMAVVEIAKAATNQFLDAIFLRPTLTNRERESLFRESGECNVLTGVEIDDLLGWCKERDVEERLVLIAGAIYPFEKESQDGGGQLTKQALALIEAAMKPSQVIRALASATGLDSGIGFPDSMMANHRRAFEKLTDHKRLDVREAANEQVQRCKKREEETSQFEREYLRRLQRFE